MIQRGDPEGAATLTNIANSAKRGWEIGKEIGRNQNESNQELTEDEMILAQHYENIRLQQEELNRQRQELMEMQQASYTATETSEDDEYENYEKSPGVMQEYADQNPKGIIVKTRNKKLISW